jgi:hypothetical protein
MTMSRMLLILKRSAAILFCLAPLVFSSCLTMSLPKSARVEPSPTVSPPTATASVPPKGAADTKLIDTWELQYQVNDKGDEERPRAATRTLIEFTDRGQVIFNRMDKENSDSMKHRSGRYAVEQQEVTITDDAGNTVRWPYQVVGDTLVLTMPELKKKFYWRRYR